jgi:hypothetical protein
MDERREVRCDEMHESNHGTSFIEGMKTYLGLHSCPKEKKAGKAQSDLGYRREHGQLFILCVFHLKSKKRVAEDRV